MSKHDDEPSILVVFVISALVLLLPVAIWGLVVAFSWLAGQGDADIQKNSANNWTSAQAGFQRDNQTYQTFLTQIRDAKQRVADYEKAHPNLGNGTPFDPIQQRDDDLRDTVQALTQQCQNTASSYNTASQSYLSKDFKDAGLPEMLDPERCSLGG
jgi:hypothetical protein